MLVSITNNGLRQNGYVLNVFFFFFFRSGNRRQRPICNFYYANSINNSNTYVWARVPRRTNIQSDAICPCCLPRSRKVTMRGEERFTIVTGRLLPTSITLRGACLALTIPRSFKLAGKKQSYFVMHRACYCTTILKRMAGCCAMRDAYIFTGVTHTCI